MAAAKGHYVTDSLANSGDLIVRFTTSGITYANTYSQVLLVDSKSMLRVSNQWAVLLATARPCGLPCNHQVVNFTGNNIKTLVTFLAIIHHHFYWIPGSMPGLLDLFNLVQLASSMGSVQLLRPWINTWLKDHRHWYDSWDWKTRTCLEGCQMRFRIAMILGEKQLVKHMANRLRILGEHPTGATQIFRNILSIRSSVIVQLLEAYLQSRADWARGLHRQCEASRSWCTNAIQQTLSREASRNIYNLNGEYQRRMQILDSIDGVYDQIMNIDQFSTPLTECVIHHVCNPIKHLWQRLNQIIENVPSPVDQDMERDLDANAITSGLDCGQQQHTIPRLQG
ncbi:hypothetical protein PG988_005874 [Apiospora saccharicola]